MHPARGDDADVLERAVNVVFVFQTVRGDIELQHADRPQDQIVRHQRAKELRSAFIFSGSRRCARRNSSGAKLGMPVNTSFSPSLKLSPIEMVPWLCKPITSPGYASSAISRSDAMKVNALASFTSLPVRTCSAFMPDV